MAKKKIDNLKRKPLSIDGTTHEILRSMAFNQPKKGIVGIIRELVATEQKRLEKKSNKHASKTV